MYTLLEVRMAFTPGMDPKLKYQILFRLAKNMIGYQWNILSWRKNTKYQMCVPCKYTMP